jgi:hypothetical protein
MSGPITNELIDQYHRMWRTLQEIVEKTPDEQWCSGSDDYLLPARLAYHILFTVDLYTTHLSYEEYKTIRVHRLNWETARPDELPSRAELLSHIEALESRVKDWIEGLSDEGLLKEQVDYQWTGKTALGRSLYVLRHSQNHIGELNAELRRRGIEGGRW